jgi:hypothetical protein
MVSADMILFYTDLSTVYRSDDFGNSHYPVSNSLPTLDFPKVYYSNGSLFCSGDDPLKIYRSQDLGTSWDSLSLNGLPLSNNDPLFISLGPDRLWLTAWQGLYYFNDSLGTWILYSDSLYPEKMETINGTLYASSTGNGFLRFDMESQQWIPENSGLETTEASGFCALDSVLFLSTAVGPYRSANLYNWEPFYDNMNGLTISVPKKGNGKLWVSSGRNLYSSDDNGVSFSKENWNLPVNFNDWIFTDSCYYWIAWDSLYISYDQGNTWIKKTAGLPYTTQYPYLDLQCLGINSDYLFLGTNYGLFRATFPDLVWQQLNSVYANGLTWIGLDVHDSLVVLEKEIYTNDYYFYAFRSANNGESFDSLTVFSPLNYTQFAVDGNTLFAANEDQLFESVDGGYIWDGIPVPVNINQIIVEAKDPAIVVSGTYFDGTSIYPELLMTYDHGITWNDIWNNLPLIFYLAVVPTSVHEDRLFASSSEHGIWYRDDLLTGSDDKVIKPGQILELYPNPSDGKFDVKLNRLDKDTYTLRIFNTTGNTIYSKTLNHQFEGPLALSMNLTELPAGLYLVSVSSGRYNYSQKLLIR